MSKKAVLRHLAEFLRPMWPVMAVSSLCRVVNQGLGVVLVAVAASGVVAVAEGGSVGRLTTQLGAIAVVKGLFRYLEQFSGHFVAFRLLSRLRVFFYRSVAPLSPAGLGGERSGDLVARATADVDRVEPLYAHAIAPLVSAVTVPALVLAWLGGLHPRLALALLPFLVAAAAAPLLRAGSAAQGSQRLREASATVAAYLTDAVQGLRDLLAFGAGDQRRRQLEELGRQVGEESRGLARVAALRVGAAELAAGAGFVVVLAVALRLVEAGEVTLSAAAAAVAGALVGFSPLRALDEVVPDAEEALAAAGRLFELSARPVPVVSPPAPGRAPADGGVDLEGVSVGYPGRGIPALERVSLAVAPGELVALVGASGSGKSTLVQLLPRLRDPEEGRVVVGGVDVRQVELPLLRRHVGLVEQRSHLFFGTIADNLRLAEPDATPEQLAAALGAAGLGEWVASLPAGLDTPVGELGELMSGGQGQRLAVARVLLRRPRVLILDEATSMLDADGERQLLQAVRTDDRTVIVVAHRLASVAHANRIVVLDQGRVVEEGGHRELLSAGGVYAALWARQHDQLDEVVVSAPR